MRLRLAIAAALALGSSAAFGVTEQTSDREVVVDAEADELPTAYGAPPDVSHGRLSTLTKSYVLAPYSFELETGYVLSVFRHGPPYQVFLEEIEMGLPARFTVGIQNQVAHLKGETSEHSFTLEGRYALANWNKLPLNPAISAEYRFGKDGNDAGELALLLSHDFPHLIEWSMNIFVDREFGAHNTTSVGFAQSAEIPVLLPEEKLEVGIEMLYRSGSEVESMGRTNKGFSIGPTLAYRRTKSARFDLSPLIGCSSHTPALEVLAIFSLSFGGSNSGDTDPPTASRGR